MVERLDGTGESGAERWRFRVETGEGTARVVELRASRLLAPFVAAMAADVRDRFLADRAEWCARFVPDASRFVMTAHRSDRERTNPAEETTYAQALECAIDRGFLAVDEARRVASGDREREEALRRVLRDLR